MQQNDTIAAVATGAAGALAIIRMSGPQAIRICDSVFTAASAKPLCQAEGYTLHYGEISDGEKAVDDVIVSVFRSPRSYTGEDMVEVSCHGSRYIQQEILSLFVSSGARTAEPGEFTARAFLAGKLDLLQAEAVADMIASGDRATHALAMNQMRGGYSAEFAMLRAELLTLVSLLELELDFGEEDVEFAERSQLLEIMSVIAERISSLIASFSTGRVIKEGVAVAIAGSPNVGKSTLLNALLKDDRAMVSDIPGTTRDVIEETIIIDGVKFRFLDTAGIRSTNDSLEKMGIERTMNAVTRANIILYVFEASNDMDAMFIDFSDIVNNLNITVDQKLLLVVNKSDKQNLPAQQLSKALVDRIRKDELNKVFQIIAMSAKTGENIPALTTVLSESVETGSVFNGETVVSNTRHYEALLRASESLIRVQQGLSNNIAADLLSQDIRETLHHLGTITGEITTDEILSSIFSKFCIGK